MSGVGETFSSGMEALKKRYGPLTGWQYGSIVIGAYVVYRFARGKAKGQTGINKSITATPNGFVDTTQLSPSEMAVLDAFNQGFTQLGAQISAMGNQNTPVNPLNPGLPTDPHANLFLLASNLQLASTLPRFQANASFLNRWASDLFDMASGRSPVNNTEVNGILSWLQAAGLPVDRLIDNNSGAPTNNAPVWSFPVSNGGGVIARQPAVYDFGSSPLPVQYQPFTPSYSYNAPQQGYTIPNIGAGTTSSPPMLDYMTGEWVTQTEYNMRQNLRQPGAYFGPQITQHTVSPGDTLATLAGQYLGSPYRWPEIYDANRQIIGQNPAQLYSGQRLTILSQPGYFSPTSSQFFTPQASAARNTVAQSQMDMNLAYQQASVAATEARLAADRAAVMATVTPRY